MKNMAAKNSCGIISRNPHWHMFFGGTKGLGHSQWNLGAHIKIEEWHASAAFEQFEAFSSNETVNDPYFICLKRGGH